MTLKIAITSQNRRTVTQHAGKCRNFWIYDIDQGQAAGRTLIELPIDQSFHANHHQLAAPLGDINVLITGSMGAGLHARLQAAGIVPVITGEENPDQAVRDYLTQRQSSTPPRSHAPCAHHPH